ncbi:endonuclease/exonuclease/phosphatase family protein [Geodermatophilus obscurus]|uniref:Endonuclease/exonuclease/phosphatase n=1 Tax=Geodermatophilus obscurus (strain ATCC 25078 / DSM 43160 / JCM 3152 / CCUG 61914 / KCC A-0152 / KCTC 9177 / NBRC 13315 / NRRL B-3577 / G-20) TaxID=526225 RepID=D2SCI6_GEOOG|nr:endonuclease/exonuclease/phosphatase family protein [Geodermatophilus obscurus]ADB76314.1 Endonuclease/exonuclease/phosphatase [Geodermatophilus obscurus DSM 43160]
MRIGTWNLRLCPTSTSTSERGQAIAAWMDAQAVDVWLLTEVHRDWAPRDGHLVVSPRRSDDVECKRWAAIESKLPMSELTTGDSPHPGDEGLVLARLALDGTSVLVACSVLPWKGAAKYWNGLPPGQFDQWRFVLDHHVRRITAERRPGEALVWGGDLNQELTPPTWGGTRDGATTLRAAFEYLGLTALTQGLSHLNRLSHSIDHLAVSADVLAERVEVHRPTWADHKDLSDHAAYIADVWLPASAAGVTGVDSVGGA